MLSEEEWIALLQKYWIDLKTIDHCIWVSQVCYELATKINRKANKNIIDVEKVKITWLLHDIWKSREWIHEINSVNILRQEWLKDISEIVLHGFVYEYCKVRWIDNPDVLPKNLEQKIVILSDMYYNQNQQRVTINKRFDDIISRYSSDADFIEAITLARERMITLEEEINRYLK